MKELAFTNELDFLVSQYGLDESTIIAKAVRKGMQLMYHDALIEAYLSGTISHDQAMKELGSDTLEEVIYQREVIKRDVQWGLTDE
jgi:hypothetical protein